MGPRFKRRRGEPSLLFFFAPHVGFGNIFRDLQPLIWARYATLAPTPPWILWFCICRARRDRHFPVADDYLSRSRTETWSLCVVVEVGGQRMYIASSPTAWGPSQARPPTSPDIIRDLSPILSTGNIRRYGFRRETRASVTFSQTGPGRPADDRRRIPSRSCLKHPRRLRSGAPPGCSQ